MKWITFAIAIGLLSSCAAPRYQYVFDRFDYQSGRKAVNSEIAVDLASSDLIIQDPVLSSSIDNRISPAVRMAPKADDAPQKELTPLSRAERRAVKQELRKEIRAIAGGRDRINDGDRVNETKELDQDLKLAIIFGAIGITLAVLGGLNTILWVLGIVGLVIGLVFFIRWIQTQ